MAWDLFDTYYSINKVRINQNWVVLIGKIAENILVELHKMATKNRPTESGSTKYDLTHWWKLVEQSNYRELSRKDYKISSYRPYWAKPQHLWELGVRNRPCHTSLFLSDSIRQSESFVNMQLTTSGNYGIAKRLSKAGAFKKSKFFAQIFIISTEKMEIIFIQIFFVRSLRSTFGRFFNEIVQFIFGAHCFRRPTDVAIHCMNLHSLM